MEVHKGSLFVEQLFYACNIIVHRTRRQAVQHKIYSSHSILYVYVCIYNVKYMSMPLDERHRIGVDTFSSFKIEEAPVT